MAYSQAKNKQQQESDKRNCVQVKFKFTKSTDADILEWLSALDNKQGYIKRLIRRDLEQKKGFEPLYILGKGDANV
jgi:hypothetical protein